MLHTKSYVFALRIIGMVKYLNEKNMRMFLADKFFVQELQEGL